MCNDCGCTDFAKASEGLTEAMNDLADQLARQFDGILADAGLPGKWVWEGDGDHPQTLPPAKETAGVAVEGELLCQHGNPVFSEEICQACADRESYTFVPLRQVVKEKEAPSWEEVFQQASDWLNHAGQPRYVRYEEKGRKCGRRS